MLDFEEASQYSETDDGSLPYQVSATVWMVPCSIDSRNHVFVPLSQPAEESNSDKGGQNRQMWTTREDEVLKGIITVRGTKAWTAVAGELNAQFHMGRPIRQGKQCRERWFNHLDPYLRKGNWTAAEDLMILEKQLELGNRWSEIAKIVKGRNENSVKNRWKSMIRKAQKELPPGTDVVRWLIAEKTNQQMEVVESNTIQIYSPVVYAVSPPPPLPLLEPEYQQTAPILPVPMRSIEIVKKGLRNLEPPPQSQQTLTWSPYGFTDSKEATMSPSSFLAIK